jgi:hypothetical protein
MQALSLCGCAELFLERIAGDPKLLQPALELQRVMRRKTFGADYWTKQQEVRTG